MTVLSDTLSSFATSTKLEAVPQTDVAQTVDAFVNWVGCAIVGANTKTVDAAVRAYKSISADGSQAILGRPERFGLVDAISLDCLSSAVYGFDDTHLETILHPTGPVAAALLGTARQSRMSGKQYIEALFVGMEIECRVALAFTSKEAGSKFGWYSTGIAGGVGAAAAVGKTLGFNNAQMLNALGLGAARASGNRGTHGSMAGTYVPSLAAESGFMAAKLTEAGFTCGARALDGNNGMLDLITTTPALERALRGLGSVSEATRTAFKPYPAGIVVHPIIDACLSLVRDKGVTFENVEKIDLKVSDATYILGGKKHPKDEFEAIVSTPHWVAAILLNGGAGIAQLEPAIINDPKIRAFQDRVFLTASKDVGNDQCGVTVELKDGRRIELWVEHAIGSLDRPMTSSEIDSKFLLNAKESLGEERATRLLGVCRNVLNLDDVTDILAI